MDSTKIEALRAKLTADPDFVEERDQRPDGLQLVAHSDFPTRFGHFRLYGFWEQGKEHTAVVCGDVRGAVDCPVRIHSECHTGDVWGSLRCDCRAQLEAALDYIGSRAQGAVLYLRQEGRGIGLLNKIRAYRLQDLGLDTIEANHYLGFPADARSYEAAARMVELLGIQSIAILSNNPHKIERLREAGVPIATRLPLVVAPNPHNSRYLETKRHKMGHLL